MSDAFSYALATFVVASGIIPGASMVERTDIRSLWRCGSSSADEGVEETETIDARQRREMFLNSGLGRCCGGRLENDRSEHGEYARLSD